MKRIFICLSFFLFFSLAGQEIEGTKYKLISIDKVLLNIEIRTPIPKKMQQYTTKTQEINLHPLIAAGLFDKIKWDDSTKFLNGLFLKYKKFKIGKSVERWDAPATMYKRSQSGNRLRYSVIFFDGKKEILLDDLYGEWIKSNTGG